MLQNFKNNSNLKIPHLPLKLQPFLCLSNFLLLNDVFLYGTMARKNNKEQILNLNDKFVLTKSVRKLLTLYGAVDKVTAVLDLFHLGFDHGSYSRVAYAKNEG